MSVIVKGMQMPKSCMECPLFSGAGCKATKTLFNILTNVAVRVKGCPLVELPEKHGRLIDGGYLYNRLKALGLKDENVFRIIKEEPTVVESEE